MVGNVCSKGGKGNDVSAEKMMRKLCNFRSKLSYFDDEDSPIEFKSRVQGKVEFK